jgi:hypothetical protein
MSRLANLVLALILLLPRTAPGQGMQLRIPAPSVTAATADWQINDEPIVVSGLIYYPTRETRMFDPQDMMQVDVYKNVPVYADVSIEPFTLVFVPLTPDRLRTYERRRDDNPLVISGRGRVDPRPVGTAGVVEVAPQIVVPELRVAESAPRPSPASRPTRALESIPPPRGANGIWVEYEGRRWYSDGPAVPYSPERFVRAADYHGFAVYRERGRPNRIWITTVDGGLLAPYMLR